MYIVLSVYSIFGMFQAYVLKICDVFSRTEGRFLIWVYIPWLFIFANIGYLAG